MISRRSKPPQPPSPPPVCGRVLASSSQYNSRLGPSPTFFNTSSSASSSPLMSPNSSGYFSHPSSPGYSSAFSSPVRPQQPPPQQQQQQQLQTNENIVYENLIKLLQFSN